MRCIVRTAYTRLLEQGAPIAGYLHQGYFYDHSTPGRYLQGNLNLLAGAAAFPRAPGPRVGIHPSADIHPTAEVCAPVLIGADARIGAGARVGPFVVVGAGARVLEGVRLRECVLWPGATADASGARLILTPDGAVHVPASTDPALEPR